MVGTLQPGCPDGYDRADMTASLPGELIEVFERPVTADLVTIDDRGRPLARSATPWLHEETGCIDVEAPAADDARRDPHVALLLCNARMVLVQGTAKVGEAVRVRPERVYAWPGASTDAEPTLYDWHIEEVRSAHNEEPETRHPGPEGGGPPPWDARLDALETAALAFVGPDGFPFAVRVPVRADRGAGVVRIGSDPVGAPIDPGPACLSASGVQVLGDLVEDRGDWVLLPHRYG
jgi:hypothetical protein